MKHLFLSIVALAFAVSTFGQQVQKQIGLVESQTLVTVPFEEGEPVITSLCPSGQFWLTHPDAPWNAFWVGTKAAWVEQFPAVSGIDADDPDAPWNQPEPSRDPADYPGLLWAAPSWVPLVKIPAPVADTGKTPEPVVVWLSDRVERQWTQRPLTAIEIAKQAEQAGYSVQPEGFILALHDKDRALFGQMLVLVREGLDLGLITDATPQTIADKDGELHTVTTLRFRAIMIGYGSHYKAMWDALKASEN